ncbi:hypothetical protein PVAND_004805 [Polypedilum vanderplanki]|uniref:Exonuclease domain-containing protein n=1 Tax=Polypedilum vanderplanki TaxID=319348 RepID=A0A9J6BYA4_POLVA|nr:hypothetical protein PVAND_004805 [Polypedilum vanderplanki]
MKINHDELSEKKISTNEDLIDEPIIKKVKMEDEELCSEFLSTSQFKIIKKSLVERRNQLLSTPKFRFYNRAELARISQDICTRKPIFLEDIQNILLSAVLKSNFLLNPHKWCVLEKTNKITQTVIILLNGPTSYNFVANESLFIKTGKIFEHQYEVTLANDILLEELLIIPWIYSNKKKVVQKYGSLEAAFMFHKNLNALSKFFSIEDTCINEKEDQKKEIDNQEEHDAFPRTRLLLSPLQMIAENYPLPFENNELYKDYRLTKDKYKPVTPNSRMFGLDCEMVRSVKAYNELARVSIVDEDYNSVYETLVRPDCKIVNYLTRWSGITKEMMIDATKSLKEVQDDVCNLLPADAILVGQSLNCDLNAMKLMHPYVIDTSVIYNLSGNRNVKTKLQTLARHFLDIDIQNDEMGHSSVEDSITCLKLAKLKLSKDICFGDAVLQKKSKFYTAKKEEEPNVEVDANIIKTVLVTSQNPDLNFKEMFNKNYEHHNETSAEKAIETTCKVVKNNDYCVTYINVMDAFQGNDSNNDPDEKISKCVLSIDKYINEVWENMMKNGLLIVIFGGRQESNDNALTMMQIKK